MTTATDIRTARRTTARRSRRLLGALVTGGALAAAAAPALALPPNPPPPPINLLPSAALTATPNPVVVPRPVVVAPVTAALPAPVALGATVRFDASGSRDLDGSIVRYEWDLDGVAGFESTTAAPTITRRYLTTGNVVTRVRVTDDRGATPTTTHLLRRHHAPTPRIATSRTVAVVGDGITFDGGGSTDDGAVTAYAWDLDGDGTFERTGAQVSTSYGTVGTRTVRLRVTDNLGAQRTATASVRIHRAPTAVIVTRPPSPVAGRPIVLDGSNSSDDGPIARHEWDLDGDGTYETDTAAVPTATTTFAAPGPVRVGLRVTDADGATDTTTLQMTVTATPPPADTVAPRLSPTAKRLKMDRRGRVTMRFRCPATEQMCRVRVDLRGLARPLTGRKLGTARVTLPGGRTLVATSRLTPAARRAVSRRPMRARAIVTTTDAAGNRAVTRSVVTIRR